MSLAIVAYLIAVGIVRFAIELAVGAETARTSSVVAACLVSAVNPLFTMTCLIVAYLVHGRTSG